MVVRNTQRSFIIREAAEKGRGNSYWERNKGGNVFAMMINRLGNTAERLGMITVSGDEWDAASPIMEDSALIFT